MIPCSTFAIVISTLVAVLVILIILFLNNFKVRSKAALSLLPGNYGWPIVGETLEFFGSFKEGAPERFFQERVERYQSKLVFKTSLVGKNVAVFCGPAGNKFLFSNENKLVNLWRPPSVKRLLGFCLPNAVGDEAKQMRKLLSNFVSTNPLLRLYANTVDLVIQQHIQTYWKVGKKRCLSFLQSTTTHLDLFVAFL